MELRTIKEIRDECIALAKETAPKLLCGGSLYKWRGCVDRSMIGEFKYDALPNFGLNIYDDTDVLPCLTLNPMKNLKKLLHLYGHIVEIDSPELVVEIFVSSKTKEYCSVHMLVNAEQVYVVERSVLQDSPVLKESQCITFGHNSGYTNNYWEQKFIPLKISSVLLTSKSKILCLILACLIDSDAEGNDTPGNLVWLVLRNEQTLWKDMLLPFQIYKIIVSGNISRDCFSQYSSLLSVVDDHLDPTFHQILHHKDFIKTNAAIFLPEEAKVVAMAKSFNSVTLPHPEVWYSVADPKLKHMKFTSVVGVIREVRYRDSYKSKNCMWCSFGDNFYKETVKEPPNSEVNEESDLKQDWSDVFTTPTSTEKNEDLLFPDVSFDVPTDEKITGFGVRGGSMCVEITLQHNLSYDVISVYLKRWKLQQYPAGLVPGVTVCVTDVNGKFSKSQKMYFVGTPFTRILHLSSESNKRSLGAIHTVLLMKFAFPTTDRHIRQIWGILELELLLKASISAKCRRCKHSFVHYNCSNRLCPNFDAFDCVDFEIDARARVYVHNVCGSENSTLYMKGENVQKYLGLPSRIWRKFCHLSANGELLFLHQRDENEPVNVDASARFFYYYCKYFRPKKRFHVICKQYREDVTGYFCVDLEEVTEDRLAFTRLNLKKQMEEKKGK